MVCLVRMRVGDYVFLQPAEPGVPLYIGLVLDLFQVQQEQEHAATLSMQVTVSWFYRPQELEIDSELPVYENEIFAADEHATHPLESGRLRLMRGLESIKLFR